MQQISSLSELRLAIKQAQAAAKTIGLVPTMGYLHRGHQQLMEQAREISQCVIVSIFVNPLQFAAHEDLGSYPRNLEHDLALCEAAGVDIVFTPGAHEMIPQALLTQLSIPALSSSLCGKSRPGHFAGVCTIVAKLFNLIQPDYAFFGQKDIQQLRIIRQLVTDLNYPINIVAVPTVRAADGLALSSRNSYLNEVERKTAQIVPQLINQVAAQVKSGLSCAQILEQARQLVQQQPLARIDYIEIVAEHDLLPTTHFQQNLIIAVAIFIGTTRLIDNRTLIYDESY